jgi:Ran GTPase-activating protein (RanGAP) involved in mRNA processing and transport
MRNLSLSLLTSLILSTAVFSSDSSELLKDKSLGSLEEKVTFDSVSSSHKSFLKTQTYLHYSGAGINDEGAEALAIGLKHNTVIVHVDLNHNKITKAGIKNLALSLTGKPVTQFHIYGSKIGDEGHVLLAEAVKTWKDLAGLDVRETDMGDVGLNALADALKGKDKLQTFLFASNKISQGSSTKLLKILAGFSSD